MKAALITGGTSGMGLAMAKLLAGKGHNLVIVARSKDKLIQTRNELEKEYGVKVHAYVANLSDPSKAKAIYDKLLDQHIEVTIFFNNAGFADYGELIEADWNKQEHMIALNVTSMTYLAKLIGADMAKRKHGYILNIASTAAFFPGPLMSVYYATKAYVLSFSLALREELKEHGVHVTVLCPGPTATGFQDRAHMQESKLVKGRELPTPDEVMAYGYNALLKGKAIAVPGFKNKMAVFASRLLPRAFAARIVMRAQASE